MSYMIKYYFVCAEVPDMVYHKYISINELTAIVRVLIE